jgi:hypothetical protein
MPRKAERNVNNSEDSRTKARLLPPTVRIGEPNAPEALKDEISRMATRGSARFGWPHRWLGLRLENAYEDGSGRFSQADFFC